MERFNWTQGSARAAVMSIARLVGQFSAAGITANIATATRQHNSCVDASRSASKPVTHRSHVPNRPPGELRD